MADEVAVDMDSELSVDAGFSPASSQTSKHSSPKSPMLQGKRSRYDQDNSAQFQPENEKEEGELESDVSSGSDPSPARIVQLSSGGLFSQKIHEKQEDISKIVDSSWKEKEVNAEIADISLGISEESSHDDDLDYQEVKIDSMSDVEMSSENEGHAAATGSKDSNQQSQVSSNSDSSDFEDEQSESEFDNNQEDIVNISESEKETSEIEDSDEIEKQGSSNNESSTASKITDVSLEKRGSGSESDSRNMKLGIEDSRSNSSQFKRSKRDKDTNNKNEANKQQHTDDEAESFTDHLQIAAPQQTAVLEARKKSSKEKMKRDRSSSKEDKERNKSRDKRRDDKERSKYDFPVDRHDKKHRKHEENRYDKFEKKREKEPDRLKSSVEKKRTQSLMEEDLRKRLLQKRSTRDDVSSKADKKPRDSKERHKIEDKYTKNDKTERKKEGTLVKLHKEEKDKTEDLANKKSKNTNKASKEVKEYKKDREKVSVKSSNDEKGKKRPRDKLKSSTKRDKPKLDSDSSENESKPDKSTKKPSAKRPRSAEQTTDATSKVDDTAEQELDTDKESSKGYKYDDISSISSEELSPPPSPIELKKPTYYPAIMGCRDVKDFQWLNKIEEGTYGVVYRARDNRTDEVVALKRLKMEKEKEGFPITSLREINTLLKAQHPNIVTVREIVVGSNMDKIYIVMDYVEHDLKALMETMTQPFLVGEVKTLMLQLLRGVQHLHDNWILHRDIKASNLLLSHKGILKIGDFGLAREYGSPLKHYTSIVVTLWYRAPELLLGAKEYKTAIDLWSVGCVFAELLTMKPLFPGKSEIDQINRVFKELGTPNDNIWPGPPAYSEYPMVKKTSFANHPYNILRQKFGATLTDKGFNLLNRLLTYDPNKRITAEEALKHNFFEESPLPVDPSMFPTWPAKSELGHRAARKHNASPKPPEGGGAASKLANDDSNFGFHMPAATKGFSAKGVGFNLKF